MKWNFHRFDEKIDYAAVSDEEYDNPCFTDEIKEIQVWLEGKPRHGELIPVTDEVEHFLQVTIRSDNKLHYYLEWNGNLYEIFGATPKNALNAIAGKGEFYAFRLDDTEHLIYSWGKEWYLVAPLVRWLDDLRKFLSCL